ncbi:hypothetical protein PRIPAC_80751 [Pristionchus pacificus]|uniref:Uncharacterized protein n=1 Tax=Pristionchus pacificus TaxID=54126 RepID=A0A2A6CP96_PRIPA|nr:hypothetical protein PRIPAC_80751 [Pristionchus pacificus]|eukprot:PDM80022.1 hypothetical protein PRIPAC_32601 [Pristionchus pacificus]
MGVKKVTFIAGVGPTYGAKLSEAGFDKAYVILDHLLLVKYGRRTPKGIIVDMCGTKTGAVDSMMKLSSDSFFDGSASGSKRKRRRNESSSSAASSRGNTPFPSSIRSGSASIPSSSPVVSKKKQAAVKPPTFIPPVSSSTLPPSLTTPSKTTTAFLAAAAPSASAPSLFTPSLRHTAPAKRTVPLGSPQVPSALPPTLTGNQDPLVLHLLSVVGNLSSEVATLKNLMVNQFTAWNTLIIGAANRSEATARETEGNKDRMTRIETALAEVKQGMDTLLSANKQPDFEYAPYSTRVLVDALDCGQGAANLATDLEESVFGPTDPDLKRSFNNKVDTQKRDWVLMCVLHRRKASVGLARKDTQTIIINRMNEYARKRKAGRVGKKGTKGPSIKGNTAKRLKVEMRGSDDEEQESDEGDPSLDLVSSRPKNNVYVIQVSDSLKRVVTSPCPGTRKRIDDYCTKKGRGKGDVVCFFPRLTREEESSRHKTRFYVDLLIRHQESINQKEFLVEVPGNGRLDRVIRESRNRDVNFKREYLSYEQVAEIVGSTTDLIDKQYDVQCSKKKDIASRKRTSNDIMEKYVRKNKPTLPTPEGTKLEDFLKKCGWMFRSIGSYTPNRLTKGGPRQYDAPRKLGNKRDRERRR